MPRGSMSSVNAGLPFASLTASTFTSGLPTTAISGTSCDGIRRGTAGDPVGGSEDGSYGTPPPPSVIGVRTIGPNASLDSPRRAAAARLIASIGFT